MDKEITVIVTLYKTPEDKLRSLQQYKNYKVLIFDQSTQINLKKKIQNYSKINCEYYFSKKNIGLPKASNFLLSKVKTKYCLFTQPDIEINNRSIQNLKSPLKRRKDVIFAGPTFLHKKKENVKMKKNYKIKKKLNAACMLCDTKKLKQIGFFNEDFFLYWEDVFLMRKINLSKFKMTQVLNSYAKHSPSQSSAKTDEINFIRNLNFKYGELLFDFKTKKFRILKMIRQIIQNIIYCIFNLILLRKKIFLINLSNIFGISKFILFYLKTNFKQN